MRMALCHPDRPHGGLDMCASCYAKWKWRNNPEWRESKIKYAAQYRAERDADPIARQVYLEQQKGSNKKRNRRGRRQTVTHPIPLHLQRLRVAIALGTSNRTTVAPRCLRILQLALVRCMAARRARTLRTGVANDA